MNPIPYKDLHKLEEDDRIDRIGQAAMRGSVTGVIVDAEPKKIKRYIRKLKKKFFGIRIIDQFPGPVAGTVVIKVGPPQG